MADTNFLVNFSRIHLAAPLVVNGISPDSGALTGGTPARITGSGFRTGMTVTLDGVPATDVVVVDSTTTTARTGAHAEGVVSLVVTRSDNQSVTLPAAYTYRPAPTLSGIAPAYGSAVGATAFSLTGTGFMAGATVTFGDRPASSTVLDATGIVGVTPGHRPGFVAVVLTNPDGQMATLSSAFLYLPATFNADNHPDLLWRNEATGQNRVWYMNGAQCVSEADLPTLDQGRQVVASGDFNADGSPDLVWQDAKGKVGVAYLNGTTLLSQAEVSTVPDTNWHVVTSVRISSGGTARRGRWSSGT